ncbi:hypothetical protein, partial [Micromonospora sp. NPDC049799]|uniref:hypothetical protein n=1 Tax=Micromonospora sp. NPDC049799 TaxID=3154741 RepID=UPI0033C0C2EC
RDPDDRDEDELDVRLDERAAATAVAVLLLKLLVSDAALDSSGYLRSLLAGGMYAGAVLGAPLALVAALRPTTSTGGDAPTIGDGT